MKKYLVEYFIHHEWAYDDEFDTLPDAANHARSETSSTGLKHRIRIRTVLEMFE